MDKGGKDKKVYVGLSGGVDSSVTAVRLMRAGYDVTGVFIKTWQPDFLICNWERERLDAMRVAAHLGIPFKTFDAEDVYKNAVADAMIQSYAHGETPNPDVLCNREVKFGAFLKYARSEGADYVATGHYAQVQKTQNGYELHRGADPEKDQSYFLWTLTQDDLAHTLFPVGDTQKENIRMEAHRAHLSTATKRDSQGVCFLGDIDMRDFLSHYIDAYEGDVLNETGEVIGTHYGAVFYTVGQRHGFAITHRSEKDVPLYIIEKDIAKNTLIVSIKPPTIAKANVMITHTHWINEELLVCEAQFRYRQKPFAVRLERSEVSSTYTVHVDDTSIDLPSSGQSCVLYQGTNCLGGGIIRMH